jgi:hypothetical protein
MLAHIAMEEIPFLLLVAGTAFISGGLLSSPGRVRASSR